MKPATLGLFVFLASFLIYTVVAIILVGLVAYSPFGFGDRTADYLIAVALATTAAIVTGYLAWMFEKG